MMDKTISLQSAVELIKNYCENGCDLAEDNWCPSCQREQFIELLKALPSAQPERTCVNCGRTANNGGWYADGGTRCPIEEHYALPKDGFCHLWEKRNVTDDDYPERRTDGRD